MTPRPWARAAPWRQRQVGGSQGAGWGAISDSSWSAQVRAPPDNDVLAKQVAD